MGHFQIGVLHPVNSHESSLWGETERERGWVRCRDILGTAGAGQGEDTGMSHSAVRSTGGASDFITGCRGRALPVRVFTPRGVMSRPCCMSTALVIIPWNTSRITYNFEFIWDIRYICHYSVYHQISNWWTRLSVHASSSVRLDFNAAVLNANSNVHKWLAGVTFTSFDILVWRVGMQTFAKCQ